MRVAVVHDWLIGYRGGEKVLSKVLELFPAADIFTLFHKEGETTHAIDSRVQGVSALNFCREFHRYALPLYPMAVRRFDFRGYDLVLSLSHAAAKNVQVPQGVPHLSYCFSPMRYVWDQQREYFSKPMRLLGAPIFSALRRWDRRGAQRVTDFAVISELIRWRVQQYYGRSSTIVYPPVDTRWITPASEGKPGEAFLFAGALVPYKRPDVVVAACRNLGLPLWVVGDGPMRQRLEQMAGAETTFFGALSDEGLSEKLRHCRALVYPGVEDFGLLPVECMAAGRPVIGQQAGGLCDTVLSADRHSRGVGADVGKSCDVSAAHGATGLLYLLNAGEPAVSALERAMRAFCEIEGSFRVADCVARAQEFSSERFSEHFLGWVSTHVALATGTISSQHGGSSLVGTG